MRFTNKVLGGERQVRLRDRAGYIRSDQISFRLEVDGFMEMKLEDIQADANAVEAKAKEVQKELPAAKPDVVKVVARYGKIVTSVTMAVPVDMSKFKDAPYPKKNEEPVAFAKRVAEYLQGSK